MSRSTAECTVRLSPPGLFALSVFSALIVPAPQDVETPLHFIQATGAPHTEVFDEAQGTAVLRAELSGAFEPEEVEVHWQHEMLHQWESFSFVTRSGNGPMSHLLSVGTWKTWMLRADLSDFSDVEAPWDSFLNVYNHGHPGFSQAEIQPGATSDLGLFSLAVTRATLSFDVAEPDGAPTIHLQNPRVELKRWDYSPERVPTREFCIHARGTDDSRPVSGLTVMAPPGEYTVRASAEIDGEQVGFPGGSIHFGQPVVASPGDTMVVLSPPDDEDPEVTLELRGGSVIGRGGHTSVVTTALGPALPVRFSSACSAPRCAPRFLDIQSSAQVNATSIKVCTGGAAKPGGALALLRYEPNASQCAPGMRPNSAARGCWKDITERRSWSAREALALEPRARRACGVIDLSSSSSDGPTAQGSPVAVGLLTVVEKVPMSDAR